MNKALLLTSWFLLIAQLAFASKPLQEKSTEACEALLKGSGHLRVVQAPSSSTLIPLNLLLGSTKCDYIPSLWRWAIMYSKQFPSPGLAQMYRTAESAAEALIDANKIDAVMPTVNSRNPFDAADATLKLIDSKNPPEYIRKAVLIRSGVLVVVPLLKRTVKKSKKTGKPIYIPIITKGHQELENFDILSAAFAAWALEPWLGTTPNSAELFLQPMVEKRKTNAKTSAKFKINIRDYIPQVKEIYENFMDKAGQSALADDETIEASRPKRRCTQCNVCPWAKFCREKKLKPALDLSMMRLPPTQNQVDALIALGLGDMKQLAALNINSEDFIHTALMVGVSPDRLRHFVAHSLATIRNEVLVTKEFQFPIKPDQYRVHIDFEDLLTRLIRSGVYLFGTEIESPSGKKTREIIKHFIFAEKLDQSSVDEAWAKFILFVKNHPRLKKNNYVITMYSKHEQVKIEQQFDIIKGSPSSFSDSQRNSIFYSETNSSAEPVGRLIRRRDFFKKFPKVSPTDVFVMLDKLYDLLEPMRDNFAFPTYSVGIKQTIGLMQDILDKLKPDSVIKNQTDQPKTEYSPDQNGLNSIDWAKRAYATGEKKLFDKIRDYNEIDIDGNRITLEFLENLDSLAVTPKLRWNKNFLKIKKQVETASELRSRVDSLMKKQSLIETILGRPLSALTEEQMEEFATLTDRSQYLQHLQDLADNEKLSEEEFSAVKQFEHFAFESKRIQGLTKLFSSINPEIRKAVESEHINDHEQAASVRAMAELLSHPSSYLTPSHIQEIAVLTILNKKFNKISFPIAKSLIERLTMPDVLNDHLEKLLERFEGVLTKSQIQRLWQ